MGNLVTLTMSDQHRLHVVRALEAGRMAMTEAQELLGRSVRQVHRIVKRYREEQEASIPHRSRGRRPANAVAVEVREQVVKLARERYEGCNHHHLCELLAEEHGIELSVSTIRRLRLAAGLSSPRKRRAPKHRTRRPRMSQPGMLVQIDGSPFAWLGDAAPPFTLLAAIDDATNEVFAVFREDEDTVGYMLLLEQIVHARGLPLGFYSDRHTIFQVPKAVEPSLPEQLLGHLPRTQFGRVMQQLGIAHITAHSPQAKGRVERLFNTLQDRLVQEMKLAGITTLEAANAFLPGFLRRFNQRFRQAAADPQPAYRPAPPRAELDRILGLQYPRTVAKDHTITFGNRRLAIPGRPGQNHAGQRILVQVALNGQIRYWRGDTCLGLGPKLEGQLRTDVSRLARQLPPAAPPPPAPAPPAAPRPPTAYSPPSDHPWRHFRYGKAARPVLQSPPPARRIGPRRSAT